MEVIPFEIAKKLKEKGFEIQENVRINYFYYDKELVKVNSYWNISPYKHAPTISQVLKWLREEKKMNIEIFLYNRTYSYFVKSVIQICEDDCFHQCLNENTTEEEYDSYEEAALAGIKYTLENLI